MSDLRVMVSSTPAGFQPMAVYARRALLPLVAELKPGGERCSVILPSVNARAVLTPQHFVVLLFFALDDSWGMLVSDARRSAVHLRLEAVVHSAHVIPPCLLCLLLSLGH